MKGWHVSGGENKTKKKEAVLVIMTATHRVLRLTQKVVGLSFVYRKFE